MPALIEVAWRSGQPVPSPPRLDLEGPQLLLEIPADWDAVCAAGAGLAQEWQQAVRSGFQSAFARGYAAAGFVSTSEPTPRAAYVLRKDEQPSFLAGGGGERGVGRPLAPRARVKRPAEARQVQRQEVVAGVDARAAVDDRLFARGAERLVAPPQLRRRPEHRYRAGGQVAGPGRALRPGYVAGAGIDRLRFPAVTLGRPSVQDQVSAMPCDHGGLVDHEARAQPAGEHGRLDARRVNGNRPALGHPLPDAPVEDGHVVVAVGAEQVPQAGGDRARGVVVGDDADAGSDAGRSRRPCELRLGRPGMPPREKPAPATRRREVLVYVEKHCAGDVTRPPGVASPAGGIEIPPHVDDSDRGVTPERQRGRDPRSTPSWTAGSIPLRSQPVA